MRKNEIKTIWLDVLSVQPCVHVFLVDFPTQSPSCCHIGFYLKVLDFNPASLRPGGKKKDNFWGPNVPPNLRLRAQKVGGREGGVSPHFSGPPPGSKKMVLGEYLTLETTPKQDPATPTACCSAQA